MPQFAYPPSSRFYNSQDCHATEPVLRGRPVVIRSSSLLHLHRPSSRGDPSLARRSSSSPLGRPSDIASYITSAYAWPSSRSSSRSSGESIDSSQAAGEEPMGRAGLTRPTLSNSFSTSSYQCSATGRRSSAVAAGLEDHAQMYTLTNWTASAEDLFASRDRWTSHSLAVNSGENHLSFLIPRCLPRKPAPAAVAGLFEPRIRQGKRMNGTGRPTSPRSSRFLVFSTSSNNPPTTWASIAGRGVQSTGQTIRTYSTSTPQQSTQNQRKHEQSGSNNHRLESSKDEEPGEEAAKRRKTEHTPRTGVEETEIYVLSLWIGRELQESMDAVRRKFYPAARQRVPSHISFFRALPGSKLKEMERDIDEICRSQSNQGLSVGRVDQRNNSVFVLMDRNSEKTCQDMRSALRLKWQDFLSEQDNENRWRGHWTVIGKADKSKKAAERANACEDELKDMHGKKDKLEGLMMWKFEEHGTWTPYKQFRLGSGEVRDEDARVAEKNRERDQAQ